MNEEDKRILLQTARAAIGRHLEQDVSAPEETESLKAADHSGAFVTLHKGGQLRGCIGRFSDEGRITEVIHDMAQAAAFEDPRFPRLTPDELPQVDVEVSVLTPMRKVDDVEQIQVGRDGLYIIKGFNRGVLLPQVAVEQGWDRQTFLEHTCLKAGLPPNGWQDPAAEIYAFSAEIFGEKEFS
jgi:AmmeMemoRadiSam system protein A